MGAYVGDLGRRVGGSVGGSVGPSFRGAGVGSSFRGPSVGLSFRGPSVGAGVGQVAMHSPDSLRELKRTKRRSSRIFCRIEFDGLFEASIPTDAVELVVLIFNFEEDEWMAPLASSGATPTRPFISVCTTLAVVTARAPKAMVEKNRDAAQNFILRVCSCWIVQVAECCKIWNYET